MRTFLLGAITAISILFPMPQASAQEMEDLTRPNEADYADVAVQLEPIFNHLRDADANAVIDAAFPATSPLYVNVQSQLPNLKSQVGVMLDMYGPASNCERARRGHRGSLLIKLEYLCQHDRYVTQWHVTMLKTSQGWTLGQINFADAK